MPESHTTREAGMNQDMRHQIREWNIERIGWAVWALILLAALAGLLGDGPLSDRVAGDRSSGFWLEYKRFERYQSPTQITFHLKSVKPQVRLWINYGFMNIVEISHIDPQPEHVEAGTDRYIFPIFVADKSKDIVVTIYFKFNHSGVVHSEAGLEDGPSVRFPLLVYP